MKASKIIGCSIAGCLLLYVLSMGPAFWYLEKHIEEPGADRRHETARIVWLPLIWLARQWWPIDTILYGYTDLWRINQMGRVVHFNHPNEL